MLSPYAWLAAVNNCMEREFSHWSQNLGEVIVCGIMPVVWMLIVWALLGQGVITRVPVGFIDHDKSSISREFARQLQACRAYKLIPYENYDTALAEMNSGTIYGFVMVPFGYAQATLSGRGSSISLYVDESRYAVAGTLLAELQTLIDERTDNAVFNLGLQTGDGTAGAKRLIRLVHSDFYALGNMQYSFLAFLGASLMPGAIMIGAMFAFITAILREEWHNGKNDWLLSAKGSVTAAITGKLLPHYVFYCLIFLFYLALFCGYGGFYAAGSLLLWFICGACCIAVFATMSVLFAAIMPNWRLALVMSAGYAAPALPFTGFSIPLESMTPIVKVFAHCLPLTWYIQGQAQEWTLGAPLSGMGNTLLALAILFIVPAIGGTFLLRLKLRKFARQTEL